MVLCNIFQASLAVWLAIQRFMGDREIPHQEPDKYRVCIDLRGNAGENQTGAQTC